MELKDYNRLHATFEKVGADNKVISLIDETECKVEISDLGQVEILGGSQEGMIFQLSDSDIAEILQNQPVVKHPRVIGAVGAYRETYRYYHEK
jgi:hypothetical protein